MVDTKEQIVFTPLYKVQRGGFFTVEGDTRTFMLDHIDGMYSVCYEKDTKNPFHISASQDVIKC